MRDLGFSEQVHRQSRLMDQMVQRLRVNPVFAASVDGGLAWYEARTKCIFCSNIEQCRSWLEQSEGLSGAAEFCPNSTFLQNCFAEILRCGAVVPTD